MLNKLWAIPDIHGRNDLLQPLLKRITLGPEDKIIFLGDMIDRGPDSKGVLDTIRDLVESSPNQYIALAGNHEWLAIESALDAKSHSRELWYVNGGLRTMQSFEGMSPNMPDSYIKWMAALPLSHEEPGFFFSHAPLPMEEDRHSSNKGQPFTRSELTWTYPQPEHRYARSMLPEKVGVCGHIHKLREGVKEPRFYDHYIFADAGCGCSDSAPLVAIEVRSREVVTQREEKYERNHDAQL